MNGARAPTAAETGQAQCRARNGGAGRTLTHLALPGSSSEPFQERDTTECLTAAEVATSERS